MQITVNLPDEIARQLASSDKNPERVALEALALEGYRSRSLSESAVRRMLGFESRMDVHEFLKQHGVYVQYGLADLEEDEATFRGMHEELLNSVASHAARQK